MKKQYLLYGLPVRIELGDGMVHIVNDPSLRRVVVGRPFQATSALVGGIRADYQATFNKELAIADDSFIVEIWGHLYCDYLLLKYSKLLKVILVFGLYNRLYRSCRVIDCGEDGKDPNRWLWDKLVVFQTMLGRRLSKIGLSSRFTEG